MKITARFILGMVSATAVPVLVLGLIGISLLRYTARDIIHDGNSAVTRAHHRALRHHVDAVGQRVSAFFSDHASQLDLLHELATKQVEHYPDLVSPLYADLYDDQERGSLPGYGFIHPEYGAYANWLRRGHQGSPWIRREVVEATHQNPPLHALITRRLEQLMPLIPAMRAIHQPRAASCDLLWTVTVDGVAVTYPNDYATRMAIDPGINELDESQEDYVRAFAPDRYPSTQAAWTEPYVDSIKQRWMMSRIAPLYEGDTFIGTIGLDLMLGNLTELLQDMSSDELGYLVLLDQKGRPLAMPQEAIDELAGSPEHRRALYRMFIQTGNSGKQITETDIRLAQTLLTQHPQNNIAAAITDLLSHTETTLLFDSPHGQRLITHAAISDTGWVLASVIPSTVVDAPLLAMRSRLDQMVERSWQTLLIAVLCVGLFFSLIGAYLGLQTTRPITALIQDVERISQDEEHREIQVRGKNELAALAGSVNRMIHTIIDREHRFKTLFDNISDVVFIHDAESWAILDANERIRELYGYEPSQASSLSIDQLSLGESPYSAAEGVVYLQQAREGQRPIFEWQCRHRDGSLFWVEISMRQTLLGSQAVILVSVRDIRDRKNAERALRDSENRLRVTLDSIGDGVITTDLEGQVVRMNPVAEGLSGWDLCEAEGRPLDTVFPLVDARSRKPLVNSATQILEQGEIVASMKDSILIDRKGREYRIRNSAAPIRDDLGNILGAVFVFRDITEEHALQEQLNHSQRMDTIGRLAGGIAHDFNNMLTGIVGATDMLLLEADNPPSRSLLDAILSSAERASHYAANSYSCLADDR